MTRPSLVKTCFRFPIGHGFGGSGAGFVAETPDRIHVVVLGESLQQLGDVAGDDVDGSARQIAGIEKLVQVGGDQRIVLGRNRDDRIARSQAPA